MEIDQMVQKSERHTQHYDLIKPTFLSKERWLKI